MTVAVAAKELTSKSWTIYMQSIKNNTCQHTSKINMMS